MIKTDVLVLGGGLAGLSTAYHLQRLGGQSVLVVEKKDRAGGLAGSVFARGYTFDHTGHLLHLHDPYGRKLVLDLLKGRTSLIARSSWIYSQGRYTRYPFQANTYGLPEKTVDECVIGFLKTLGRRPAKAGAREDFRSFCLRHFGDGISRHFMFPYNRKLWRTTLDRLTAEWQGGFVPKPTAGEVLRGALMDQTEGFGYNAVFHYPRRGGIQALPDALAERLDPGTLLTGHAVLGIDLKRRRALVAGLGEVGYERLVNTLPLPAFLDLSGELPPGVAKARRALRWNSVWCLNLGIERERVSDKHWIYFPERRFPFYRVGFYSNFAASNAPSQTSSLYVEFSRKPSENVSVPALERSALAALRACAVLRHGDRIAARHWMRIPCAYVLYDFNRAPALAAIAPFLKKNGVDSIGRYGAWKYSFMEAALLDGKACAESLMGAKLR